MLYNLVKLSKNIKYEINYCYKTPISINSSFKISYIFYRL